MAVLPRRLYRNRDGRMISGVAAGLADYFDVDPSLVRLVFIIAAMINGIGIFVYIVMAFIVPVRESSTAADGQAGPESDTSGEVTSGEEQVEMHDTTREEARPPQDAHGPRHDDQYWRHREQRHTWAGLILIALGVLFLAQNMGLMWWWNWKLFWPAVLIGVGALLLVRQIRR